MKNEERDYKLMGQAIQARLFLTNQSWFKDTKSIFWTNLLPNIDKELCLRMLYEFEA